MSQLFINEQGEVIQNADGSLMFDMECCCNVCPVDCGVCGPTYNAKIHGLPSPVDCLNDVLRVLTAGGPGNCTYSWLALSLPKCSSCTDVTGYISSPTISLSCVNGVWTLYFTVCAVCNGTYFIGTWAGVVAADTFGCPIAQYGFTLYPEPLTTPFITITADLIAPPPT